MTKRIVKITEGQLKQIIENQLQKSIEFDRDRTRFRVEIYTDIILDLNPEEDFDLEKERKRAKEEVQRIIDNTIGKELDPVYIGKVYHHPISGGRGLLSSPELYED